MWNDEGPHAGCLIAFAALVISGSAFIACIVWFAAGG